ncbi:carbohydrate kinase [Carboxylicivirga sp. A043]|uniref:xylulokinase n=1 Tax=Carboxylicivirga litoralis TaxID=2816963 RepID=UPI0021CB5A8C|nr:FGGY family carbohydrate kinase [Carboxylicivirga sp. A043]MCU4157015.1 carbohydrate kinase [Carboxylicivirga sp. A043]
MYSLGFDIGSSSVKVALLDVNTGTAVNSAFYPKEEMAISSPQAEWAEQNPLDWWSNLKLALKDVLEASDIDKSTIKSIGISYQMHGLVTVDKNGDVLRPAIIWCDSRAVQYGNQAFEEIGEEHCLSHLLNSPGNFTASKLKWVKENEPDTFAKIHKIMLPGDYIAYKLTGEMVTTKSGLSEGIFWDFKTQTVSKELLENYGFSEEVIPTIKETFEIQGLLSPETAKELNLEPGIAVAYRAGDQPNNALSLNVLNPGEVAATAGTSGVVYGVSDQLKYDPASRVNTFAHVNHTNIDNRLGVLLCINGTGILNSWLRKNVAADLDYVQMNDEASAIEPGSDGLLILPFGNGAERVLKNDNPGATVKNLNFNIHSRGHMLRAAQEGIAFSFKYGMEVMEQTGIETKVIRAGKANMFLSPIFRQTLADISGSTIELYETDGALGAARGAAYGAGLYKSLEEAFASLEKVDVIRPIAENIDALEVAYKNWKKALE